MKQVTVYEDDFTRLHARAVRGEKALEDIKTWKAVTIASWAITLLSMALFVTSQI